MPLRQLHYRHRLFPTPPTPSPSPPRASFCFWWCCRPSSLAAMPSCALAAGSSSTAVARDPRREEAAIVKVLRFYPNEWQEPPVFKSQLVRLPPQLQRVVQFRSTSKEYIERAIKDHPKKIALSDAIYKQTVKNQKALTVLSKNPVLAAKPSRRFNIESNKPFNKASIRRACNVAGFKFRAAAANHLFRRDGGACGGGGGKTPPAAAWAKTEPAAAGSAKTAGSQAAKPNSDRGGAAKAAGRATTTASTAEAARSTSESVAGTRGARARRPLRSPRLLGPNRATQGRRFLPRLRVLAVAAVVAAGRESSAPWGVGSNNTFSHTAHQ
ncbi:hypothetical protein DFJ73DRAFT_766237 [Zopfochytrium polystomum]|nr:hypothetical protein DFJ73DRAFT_766237 [Zopfochytrium polystomum]